MDEQRSKCDITETSIIVSFKRDEIMLVLVSRLTGGEDFCKRTQFILYALLDFQPAKRFKNMGDVKNRGDV